MSSMILWLPVHLCYIWLGQGSTICIYFLVFLVSYSKEKFREYFHKGKKLSKKTVEMSNESNKSNTTPAPTAAAATPAATAAVTPAPTAAVTPAPTAAVTPAPTAAVTPAPTATVTPAPTATVTPAPTAAVTPTSTPARKPAFTAAAPTKSSKPNIKAKGGDYFVVGGAPNMLQKKYLST